jgi:glutamine amidotransferase-like uncharacterized protein
MTTADGTIQGTTKIVDNGPPSHRFNIVIMGDGYQAAQMNQYANDVQRVVDTMFGTPPFDELRQAINVYRVDVTSTDSGADDPTTCGGSGATARTYFDATFCGDGQNQRLLVVNDTTTLNTAGAQVPQWHTVLVVVNSTVYGGSGGVVGTFSLAPGAEEIALHELGHTAFDLADEYEYWRGCTSGETDRNNHPANEPAEVNVTTNTNRATLKWRHLVAAATAIPTTNNANCAQCDPQGSPVGAGTVGLFEGAHYFHCGAFRPEFSCKMRALGNPFCAVCRERIRTVLAPYLPPVPPVAVTAWGSNRLDVFVPGTDRAVYHKWWNGSAWGPSLTDYERQGGIILGAPTVVAWGTNRLDVFVIGTDRALYHKWWNGSAWGPSLTGYEYMGGAIRGQPKVVSWGANRLDVFVVGTDKALYHKWWNGSAWGPSLTGYERQGGFIVGSPAAEAWGPNRLDVFVVGRDFALYHKWWNGSAWGPSLTGYERQGGVIDF